MKWEYTTLENIRLGMMFAFTKHVEGRPFYKDFHVTPIKRDDEKRMVLCRIDIIGTLWERTTSWDDQEVWYDKHSVDNFRALPCLIRYRPNTCESVPGGHLHLPQKTIWLSMDMEIGIEDPSD